MFRFESLIKMNLLFDILSGHTVECSFFVLRCFYRKTRALVRCEASCILGTRFPHLSKSENLNN